MRTTIVDGREFRTMLYFFGFSSEEQVSEPLRRAIRNFDEVVVPLIYSSPVHLPTIWKIEMALGLIVDLLHLLPEDLIIQMIATAVEEVMDDRGYPEEWRFKDGQFDAAPNPLV